MGMMNNNIKLWKIQDIDNFKTHIPSKIIF